MLRKFIAAWLVIGSVTTGIANGQLPALPPSLPRTTPVAPDSTLPPPQFSVPSLPTPPPSLPVADSTVPATEAPPTVLSGTKAGQSDTAVSVDTKPATPASAIPGVATDDSSEVPAGVALSELDADGRALATLNQANADGTSAETKLIAAARRETPPRTTPNNPVSATTSSVAAADRTSFKTVGPTIQVETLGPRSIAINKPAEFEIRVTNSGSQEARGLTVEANFPAFVDLMSARPSSGAFDQQTNPEQPRMKWRIENLPPGGTQSAVLQVIPRSAMLFDFQVQWVADPLRGQAAIQVTEPKLDMRIAGPAEVQYGETAIYTVSIRNPGTGIAENVEIMLSEDLGGQRATVGNIQPGEERTFEVELIPGDAGNLALEAFAKADTLEHSAKKEIIVRRANLEIAVDGPPAAYAGTTCTYRISVKNTGDAIARDIIAAAVLPIGTQYIGGIETAEVINGGLRWNIGNLPIGEETSFEIQCVYNQAGDLRFEAGIRAADDLAATQTVQTKIAALADLVLSVESPKGPLPIQEPVTYILRVKNRGTNVGKQIQLAMQFSEGIEPVNASGLSFTTEPGEITFQAIESLEVDQELTIRVQAMASISGNHRFRAVLTCDDPVSEEIAQGTTRFYGDEILSAGQEPGRRNAAAESGLRR